MTNRSKKLDEWTEFHDETNVEANTLSLNQIQDMRAVKGEHELRTSC